jgi:ferredoxin
MATLRIENMNNRELTVNATVSILNLLLQNEIAIPNRCGGHARCGFCRITFIEGLSQSSPRTAHETRFAREAGLPPTVRLACQTYLAGDATIRIGQDPARD